MSAFFRIIPNLLFTNHVFLHYLIRTTDNGIKQTVWTNKWHYYNKWRKNLNRKYSGPRVA
jgi:hypothetical protein